MGFSAPKLMHLLAVAICSFLLMFAHGDASVGKNCASDERDALLEFKQGITEDPVGRLATWHGREEDCCRWRGVRCSNRTGHVLELRLGNANYDIYSYTSLAGEISRSLLTFKHLQHLDLSFNNLNGSTGRIPEFLASLKNLKYLNLSGISFHGRVPPQLGNLTALQYLDLSSMGATYSIDLSWLKHLHFLRYLNLDSVNLNTVADWPHVVNMLSSLRCLRLSGCSLNGKLPEWVGHLTSLVILDLSRNSYTGPLPEFIGNLTSLRTLDLSWNQFTGTIPASIGYITGLRTLYVCYNNLTALPHEIGKLSNLTHLYLAHNQLDGVITEEHFGSLKSLQHIDLSSNFLKIEIGSKWKPPFRLRNANFGTCQMGPLFPYWLRWLTNIDYLDISSTGINDRIPDWFPTSFSNARYLSMSKNQLNGALPINMEIMSSLEELDLNNNTLTGHVPKLPQNLTYLDICINSFSGPLPANVGLPKLRALSIASNHITGHLPRSICNSKKLGTLVLANNHFEGRLPECFGNKVMLFLDLSNNGFSGILPPSLQNSEMLQVLDLSRNMFYGSLPEWIGKLKSLRFLRIRQNMFSGDLPLNLTNLACLQYLDISNNGISGSLPRTLSKLKSLKLKYPKQICSGAFHVKAFSHNFSTILKGQQLFYGSIPRIVSLNMKIIDLSFNNIFGEIPEEITTLDGLINLNMSQNYFSGNVPSKIGVMRSLESLDLSSNTLSGEIPASVLNLTFLSYMDLSYNNLTGRIPSGSQLDSLYAANPSLYTGNIGLCGPPLKKGCSSTDASKQGHSTRIEESPGLEFFYRGLGCGFVSGIWAVFLVLLIKK
ncbi:unnamed protein product [Urochloa decumbens]|uniref:Leucine-rich repeat-containing N-terminal plant-type domain-containing protein n=1 Tax=Urochloa decumbens TaxID=240449 RepID=A0ABC9ATH3_9POAL